MAAENDEWPEEGEIVVCVISEVKKNGAYATIEKYGNKEGFIFVGEIAAGWVKNIRGFVRKGQRVAAKVIKVKKDRQAVELSLKSVSEERRREAMQKWKNENRATQLLGIVGDRVKWSESETSEMSNELVESFGDLYTSFEECAIDEAALKDSGFKGDWCKVFIELAVENIIPPFVNIRGFFEIQVVTEDGIEVIREALSAAEEAGTDIEEETIVTCHYDGAPRYRIEIKAPDYKSAETAWQAAEASAIPLVESAGGTVVAQRS
ncbi:MAG TPA: translation initiation factor IF-2 subunit alpha [Candidatus Poseidoniales archaeon]|nr:MAG: translation initiation factor IF-2 subunit alpha [Euryarchaeota archaeon]HHZ75023.1 translation initiation factor IF-2 subunit alpha [Candidatus Poseidoniales archaeon]PXY74397.1 MAG: translation initiation factor IF-2 subunit alpha [Euryarchaeota archaeon]PXY78869.1 MAG: translation initiation factor IF-2 subunit alpha [Euryarchaeota archaeon]HIB41003.1 translation initiation factor IF-2 subunit alpha [Candidatus Poseidoniales archaeon]